MLPCMNCRTGDVPAYMCCFSVAPFFLRRPRDVQAPVTTDIELECEAGGHPTPRIEWCKNGDIINPSDYFKLVDGHNLQILGSMVADEGMYQCFAQNDVGNIQSSSQVIITQPGSVTVVPV